MGVMESFEFPEKACHSVLSLQSCLNLLCLVLRYLKKTELVIEGVA